MKKKRLICTSFLGHILFLNLNGNKTKNNLTVNLSNKYFNEANFSLERCYIFGYYLFVFK